MRDLFKGIFGVSLFALAFFVILLIRPNSPQSAFSSLTLNKIFPRSEAQVSNPLPKSTDAPTLKTQNQSSVTPVDITTIPSPLVIKQEPSTVPPPDTTKRITISLKNQDLRYFEGDKLIGTFKISSGLPGTPTPPGEYTILAKKPFVDYRGPDYNFPKTKWNLMFKTGTPLNYYIHGAYWHNNFGHPMSHGCINVSYANVEPLYNWADVGTKISIF